MEGLNTKRNINTSKLVIDSWIETKDNDLGGYMVRDL